MLINVPVGPSPSPTPSRPQSPQLQPSNRPRKTSSSPSIPAAPSPLVRPCQPPAMPVVGYPANVSPHSGQIQPSQTAQNLPVFAFPQNRSGGQLPVFAFPGPAPGASPGTGALPVFAPGPGPVPGMALPPGALPGPHTPRTPRTPRTEEGAEAPGQGQAAAPGQPSQPAEPGQEVQIDAGEVEWMNRKGPISSIEGHANEQEGGKEARFADLGLTAQPSPVHRCWAGTAMSRWTSRSSQTSETRMVRALVCSQARHCVIGLFLTASPILCKRISNKASIKEGSRTMTKVPSGSSWLQARAA